LFGAVVKKATLALSLILALLIIPMTNAQTTSSYSPDINGIHFYLTMYSPNNQTVYNETMLLDFNLQWTYDLMPLGPLSGDYAYSIDDNPLVSIASNQSASDRYAAAPSNNFKINPSFSCLVNVSNLTSGYHKIAIFAQLYFDFDRPQLLYNGSASPVFFSVQNLNPSPTPTLSPEPTPEVEPFPTTLVIASVSIVTVVGIGLLVYFKKRK
jgi:hypothetical protein